MSLTFIDTPCIGICSTVYGDDVCKGCKRTYIEVINWNTMRDEDKASIYQRLDSVIQKVVKLFLIIESKALLEKKAEELKCRLPKYTSVESLAFYALRADPYSPLGLAYYGLSAKPEHTKKSILTLYTEMDAEILDLAEQVQTFTG